MEFFLALHQTAEQTKRISSVYNLEAIIAKYSNCTAVEVGKAGGAGQTDGWTLFKMQTISGETRDRKQSRVFFLVKVLLGWRGGESFAF